MKTFKFISILIVLNGAVIGGSASFGGVICRLEVTNFNSVQSTSTIPETPVAICTDSSGHTIVVTSNGKIYSLNSGGAPLPGMPKTLSGSGTPIAVTMDISTPPPIYVAKDNGTIHALSLNLDDLSYSPKSFAGTPVDIATSDISGFTYILMSNGTIYKTSIALVNIPVSPTPAFSGTPTAIFANPNHDEVWITTTTGKVYLYNKALTSLLASGNVTGTPVDIAANTVGDTVVATSQGNLYAIRRNGSNVEVNSTKATSETLVGVCLNYAGSVVAASKQGTVFLANIGNDTFSTLSSVSTNAAFSAVTTSLTGQIYVVGTETASSITVTPTNLSFTNVTEGTTSNSQPLVIGNTAGTAVLTFTIPTGGISSNIFELVGHTLPYSDTVPAGQSKTLNVICKPPLGTPAGFKTGTITISHNDTIKPPQTVSLNATVIAAVPSITVTPTNLSFTNVIEGTTSNSQSFVIGNPTGTATLDFTIPANGISNSMFKLVGHNLPYEDTVPVGGTKTVQVVFNPPVGTSTASPQTGTITINHNISGVPAKTINLSGTVVETTRILNIIPSGTLGFGKIGIYYKLTKAVQFINGGNSSLTVSNISITDPKYILETPVPFMVPANGGSKMVEITFAPTEVSIVEGQLTIDSDATNIVGPHELRGEGINPPLVDVFMVLDGSGSMNENTDGGLKKIQRLISAASLFIDLTREGLGDKLGIVRFDHPTVEYVTNLGVINASSKQTLKTKVGQIQPQGWTSIGNGLNYAFNELTNANISTATHKVVLLLSDGMENRPPFVDPVNGSPTITIPTQPVIEFYTVGLGLAENMNTTLLSNLAFNPVNPSKGYFHLTENDWYKLHKYFVSILSDTFEQYVIQDPVYYLGTGDTVILPVVIVDADKGATFVVYWTNADSSINVELLAPDKTTITQENAQSMTVKHMKGDLYEFYNVSFIPPSPWTDRKKGQWTLIIKGTQIPESANKERLSVSIITPSDISFKASLDKGIYSTGDTITLHAEIQEQGRPILADNVYVNVTGPNEGLGNVLAQAKLSATDFKAKLPLDSDSIYNMKSRKIAILQTIAQKQLINYSGNNIPLYDDGQHNDGAAADGIWANIYTNTKNEGVYTLDFKASLKSRLGESTTREKTLSTTVAVNKVDFAKTIIAVAKVPVDRKKYVGYNVTVIPKDSFENFMGPGYANIISINASGAELVGGVIEDNCGGYSQVIQIPESTNLNTVKVDVGVYNSQASFKLGEKAQSGVTTTVKPGYLWLFLLIIFIVFFMILVVFRWKKRP